MISRGMMNRQLYANGPGIMGLQADMAGPFEPQQGGDNTEQVVQQAINTLVNSLNFPVDLAFKYVVSVIKEIPPEVLKTGGVNLIVERVSQKARAGQKPAAIDPQIEDLLQGQQPTTDDVSVMEDLEEKQRIMREQGFMDEDDQNYAKGGIVSLRQNYGLGSIVKSVTKGIKGAVKGATKAVKNIVSSDIGKLALLAAGGYYLGGGSLFGLQRAGMSGFSFANLPGAGLFSPGAVEAGTGKVAGQGFLNKAFSGLGKVFTGGTGEGILSSKNLLNAALILGPSLLAGATAEDESPEEALAKQKAIREAEVKAQYDPIRERLGPAYNYQTRSYSAEGGKQTQGKLRNPGIASLDMPMGKPRLNQVGTPELDYRQEGGFVPPIGIKEKEDDIPAMLSNNEFVMTAEAVGGADPLGQGDRNRGAEAMYALMKKLENEGAMA